MKKYVKKTTNDKMGRPEIELDWDVFKKLCAMQCTREEIEGWFDCSDNTLRRRIREKYDNSTFEGVFKRFSAGGKISLRRTQYKLSEKSPAMSIFLGKQYLGQKDVQDVNNNHTFTGPANIHFTDNSKRDEEKEGDNEQKDSG